MIWYVALTWYRDQIPMDVIALMRCIFGPLPASMCIRCVYTHSHIHTHSDVDEQQSHFIFPIFESWQEGAFTTIAPSECNLNFRWICKSFVECITITKSCFLRSFFYSAIVVNSVIVAGWKMQMLYTTSDLISFAYVRFKLLLFICNAEAIFLLHFCIYLFIQNVGFNSERFGFSWLLKAACCLNSSSLIWMQQTKI